jgi:hypothetical protein
MENHSQIVDDLQKWTKEVVEKPHPAFGGLPMCPFAKKKRMEGKIKNAIMAYRIGDENKVYEECLTFSSEKEFDLLQVICPSPTMGAAEHKRFVEKVGERLAGLEVFDTHPDEKMTYGGLDYSVPFQMIQVLRSGLSREATEKLLRTRYYDNYTEEWADMIGMGEEYRKIIKEKFLS